MRTQEHCSRPWLYFGWNLGRDPERMLRYLGRRLLRALLLLLGVSALSFCLFEAVPGDYFAELQLTPTVSLPTLELLRKQHGLDDPLPVKYARWLGSALRGEFGYSLAYQRPAAPLLYQRARNTLILTGTAVLFAWMIAIPVGLWSAGGGRWRRWGTAMGVSTLLILPDLLVVLLLAVLAARSQVLPVGGMTSLDFGHGSFWQDIGDLAAHLVVPGSALVLVTLPLLISHTQAAVRELLHLPFVAAARANGIPKQRLLFRHVLPVAANPLITLLGFSVGTLLSSSLLVETVVGWPGLGHLLLQSILQRDLHVVVGAVIFSAVLFVIGNLVADILLYAADPRIRQEP
jgi:ABC-type dipeptide/oligopeptide/nickel transport system permease component